MKYPLTLSAWRQLSFSQREDIVHKLVSEFKINNNYTADLARVTVRLFPELESFFKLRVRAA